jgi:hypothetical protein
LNRKGADQEARYSLTVKTITEGHLEAAERRLCMNGIARMAIAAIAKAVL